MKHIFRKKFTWLFTLALAALVVIPFAAFADNISNNIDGTVDATFEVMSLNTGGPNGSANLYVVPTDGDGKNGCNFQSHETLVVSVSSSSPSVATVSPSSVTFGSCGDLIPLTVIPGSAGSTDVTLSQTSNNTGDTFTLNTASFTVNVAPPSNTAPVVTVTGVTAGGSYEYGSVPAAGCSATDAEDGPQSVSPVIGPIIGPLADYGLGSQEVTCSYTDSGSLTTTASATYSIVDRQAPIISFVSRTPANGNGWNNGNVIVTWSCTDIGPGVVAASVSQTLSAEGANQSTTGTCEDHAGNTASDTQTGINIDKTAPTIAFVSRTAANSNGWNNGDVTLNWSCADSLSGPSAATVSETVSSEGANQSATGTCQDLADNTASDTQSGINIDTADPTLVFGNASPAANGSGWNNTNVSFSFTTGDNLSGVDTTNPASSPLVLTAEGPAVTGDVTVTDKAGNSHMFTSPAVKIDKTSPVITFSNRTLANGNGWNNSNVTVNWSCGDDLSGVVATPVSTTVDSEGTNMSPFGS